MGFYGNITNTSKTNFVFDKIYSNRKAMEDNAATDGVFIGRYVLIEYGTKTPDSFIKAYGPDSDGWYYTSQNQELNTRILFTDKPAEVSDTMIYTGMVIFTTRFETISGTLTEVIDKYLVCKGGLANSKPRFEETDVETDLFFYNKNQDAHYQNSRGYDGTVWTKTSVEENGVAVIKYVNIAELNTVVPTFDIAYDAPTLYPITPHFDTDSNNVYYKLHMQPQWGLRVKNKNTDATHSDGLAYDSDELVTYKSKRYDPETDRDIEVNETYPGAIYYNETGFNVEQTHTTNKENLISILPTGKSGQLYNTHDDNYTQSVQNDTQEIVIQLPVIGDTISKIWDIVYGSNAKNSGRRYRDIEWKFTNDTDKDGDTALGGMTRDLTTIAGCINSAHDLMGMIVHNGRPEILEDVDDSLIYFEDGKYYRKGINYKTTTVEGNKIEDNVDYFVDTDDASVFEAGTKWNNEVKEVPETVHLVTRVEEPCWIEMDLGVSLNTLHGWILQMSKYFCDDVDNLTRNRETVQGTINYLNDIIDKFDKLVPGEFVVVDEYGRMQSAGYTTSQAYTSKNYGKSIDGEDTDNYLTTEDRWIGVDIDTSYENPYITITHNYTPVNPTTTVSDKNDPTDKDGINNNTEDEIYLYTPIVDAKGHVVGKNIETVTLPYGYKTITTNGLADDVTNADLDSSSGRQTIADNTQDSLAINTKNKWLQVEVTNDKVELAHEIHSITTTSNGTSNANSEDGATDENNINIPDWKYDNAGHITEKRDHYYTLPFGFKTIQTANSSGSGEAPAAKNTSSTYNTNTTAHVADTTQDTLKFAATNKWITMQADTSDDVVKFGHVLSPETTKEHKSTDTSVATFGDSFNVLNFDTDEAGHITRVGQTTITTPAGSLEDTASSNTANVLTSIKFTPSTGKIETTHQDAGTLKLGTAYTANKNGALTFDGGNTINDALSAIQTHINESEYTESGTQYFIDSITQVDGKITTTRKGTAGTLIVGENTTNNLIGENDSVNKAFDTIDKALAKEKTDREAADTTEKNARIAAINAEQAARESADNTEKAAREAAIAQEVIDRNKAIDDAIAELVDSAPDSLNTLREIVEWIDADKDGAIDLAANVAKNASDINTLNTNLKSAAYETKETFVLKTDYDTKVASLEAIILDLTNRIIALEEKMETNHPTETPTPEEGETI